MIYKYEIIIFWSNEDSAFVAEAPELPGCMAHGDTPENALKSIKEAIELWIEAAEEAEIHIPEPKGERLYYA